MNRKILFLIVLLVVITLVVQLTFAAKGGIPGRPGKPPKECRDEIDNDGDGNIDWPNDSGCNSKNDNDETDCGDSVCEGGETSETCPEDCGQPDSCSETDDWIDIFNKGTTSGYKNGEPYSYTDFCMTNETLIEYYCSGTGCYNASYPCYANATHCFDGACV